MQTEETDAGRGPEVIVVGAGPVGLSLAIVLGRAGVRTTVLERRPTTSTHPRGHVVNERTMELLRTWGIEQQVRDAALPLERAMGFGWMTSITGIEFGRLMLTDYVEALMEAMTFSPSVVASLPQDSFEPILLGEARRHLSVDVRFGMQVDAVDQDEEGATVEGRGADGEAFQLGANYVVACDGARSSVRRQLGIADRPGHEVFNQVLNIYFHADLTPYLRERPYMLWWIVNPRFQGAVIAMNGVDRWVFNFGFDQRREGLDDFTPERCVEVVRDVVGVSDLEVEVKSVLPWTLERAIAERYRDRRIFLAGDAVHRFPPSGGFGMNTGIGDVHNLGWKLGAVLRGHAGPELLDTYEAERVPVAEANAEQSVLNLHKVALTGPDLIKPGRLEGLDEIEEPEGEELRERLSAKLPDQFDHFMVPGLTLGYAYESDAVVPDGRPGPATTPTRYDRTASPGARAPHLWLRQRDDTQLTTIDLSANGFALLAGLAGRAWTSAAADVARETGVAIAAYTVGADGDLHEQEDGGSWTELFGVDDDGAVLIRPDGHVAFRAQGSAEYAETELRRALAQVLARPSLAVVTQDRSAVDV